MAFLILGDYEDEHSLHMLEHLARQDSQVMAHILDSRWLPSEMTIWLDPLTGDGEFCLPNGASVPFEDVISIYWRSYHGVAGPNLPNAEQSYIAENDARSLFESVLLRMSAKCINSFEAFRFHQTKGAQLAAVAELGAPIPATVLTNDPDAVLDFARYHPRAIYKPVQGGAHTRRVAEQTVRQEQLRHLALAPITIQEEISGTNIRVFLAGSRTAACEVRTADVDFRDDPDAAILVHEMTSQMQQQCQSIAAALKLRWTGMDFRLTPDGEYVFLEANPSPMFLGFEQATGLPLTAMLTELLCSPSEAVPAGTETRRDAGEQ